MSILKRESALIHIGFVLTGVVTTLLGPILPVLAARWSLNDAQAGYLFTAQFAGSITGVLMSSRLTQRLGHIRLLIAGFAFMCAGVAGLGVSGHLAGMASVFCYGIGLGITIPTTNLFVSDQNPESRAASLNLLNFSWSVGAVISPPIIAILVRAGKTSAALIGLAVMLALVGSALLQLRGASASGGVSVVEPPAPSTLSLWRSPFVPLIGAMVFLYVGTENAIAGWAASYALRIDSSTEALWSLAPSTFWAALLVGRLTAPAVLRRVPESKLVLMGLVAATLGASVLLMSTGIVSLLAGVALAGAGLATVFPTTIALLSHCFGESASRVAGLVFVLAGLGGATWPWVVGWVSTHFGGLRVGLGVPLFCSLAMIALQWAIIFALDRQTR